MTALLTFALVAGLLAITPGIDTALVVRVAAADGCVRGAAATIGICSGLVLWGLAATFSVVGLVSSSAIAYHAFRVAGALYLIGLGIAAIISSTRKHSSLAVTGGACTALQGIPIRTLYQPAQ